MKCWLDALRQSIVRKLTRIACPVRHVKKPFQVRDERMIEVGRVWLGLYKERSSVDEITLYECGVCGVRSLVILHLLPINEAQIGILDAWIKRTLSTADFVKAAQAADMTVFIKEVPHG